MEETGVILIVDDEKPMRHLLSLYLRHAGYTVEEAASGPEALAAVQDKTYTLILLDIMMPEMSGWEVCERVRKISDIPVIMLTARDEISDKVKGLNIGADDYITKPFEKEEMLARVRALLRRKGMYEGKAERKDKSMLTYKGIVIDSETYEAFYGQNVLSLTRKEYELLNVLLKHPGQVFSRDHLLAFVWVNQNIEDYRTVDTHIKNLREKLRVAGAPAHEIIKTVWGVGYKIQ
ncbi:response regulator transcription factor [Aneurinibacillus migulanus]|uniref:response regulator transcription factor n=1 Tax=Aneurinibacillus migulanus TaxID=47500 RepID=UPI0020A0B4DE|nr:response regulator transcription factor [Aneurinibacillus migulanus]MCP1353998.1 response regulator transcription factor [Aneurinibacillus migulanus]